MTRLMALVLSTALLAGCATAYPPPPGTVWSYTGTSGSMLNLRTIHYSAGQELCEANLAKDRYELPKNNAWAQMTLADCKETVLGPGADYWIFSVTMGQVSGLGVGASTREYCEMMRNGFKNYSTSLRTHECSLSRTPMTRLGPLQDEGGQHETADRRNVCAVAHWLHELGHSNNAWRQPHRLHRQPRLVHGSTELFPSHGVVQYAGEMPGGAGEETR